MHSKTLDYVVLDRNGNVHPKAKTLKCYTTREEAGRDGVKLFGKYEFQIFSYIEFRRTRTYAVFMRKLAFIQKLKDFKQKPALMQTKTNHAKKITARATSAPKGKGR